MLKGKEEQSEEKASLSSRFRCGTDTELIRMQFHITMTNMLSVLREKLHNLKKPMDNLSREIKTTMYAIPIYRDKRE